MPLGVLAEWVPVWWGNQQQGKAHCSLACQLMVLALLGTHTALEAYITHSCTYCT
jgi:hypothetical protein